MNAVDGSPGIVGLPGKLGTPGKDATVKPFVESKNLPKTSSTAHVHQLKVCINTDDSFNSRNKSLNNIFIVS